MDRKSIPLIPNALRALIREGAWTRPTAGLAPGYAQANLVILPRNLAVDFRLFCERNPKPCPLLEVLDVGDPEPKQTAVGADIRTDLPRYSVYRDGVLTEELGDISELWQPDLTSFLLGCSFTFEHALHDAGIPLRHWEEEKNVPMYITNVATEPAGVFAGPLVVSMRPIPDDLVSKAIESTSRLPGAHGGPVHVGNPEAIGIYDLSRPDYGEAVRVDLGEEPVFWACGVTPQAVAKQSRPLLMITHSPGHMFITDLQDKDLASF